MYTINSIGTQSINKWNEINGVSPITNTNMVAFNGYICVGADFPTNQYNYFFPSVLESDALFSVVSLLPLTTITVSIAPSSSQNIYLNGAIGTSISAGYGANITFKSLGENGFIIIKETNGATLTLT
jgi:hypothetical protein